MSGPAVIDTVAKVRVVLTANRLPFGDEIACHRTIALLLESIGLQAEREVQVSGGRGRIDFYLPADRIGLEVKVKGGPSEVSRQLLRYAEAPEIDTLVLVTGRAALRQALPDTLAGKPLHVIETWRGGL